MDSNYLLGQIKTTIIIGGLINSLGDSQNKRKTRLVNGPVGPRAAGGERLVSSALSVLVSASLCLLSSSKQQPRTSL